MKSFSILLCSRWTLYFLLIVAFATFSALSSDLTDSCTQPSLTPGPGSYRITSEDGVVRFPFDLRGGDIRFEAEVAGHQVHMLLDDGFMWDMLLFWGSPKVDSFGFNYDGTIEIGGGSDDEQMVPARTASGVTISIPGVEFTDQTALVTATSSGNASMWEGSVGQFSCTLLKHFVVDINFDEMMITLVEPDKFEYTGGGVAIPWVPTDFGMWSIPVTLKLADGRQVSLDVPVDLGYNHQFEISQSGPHQIKIPAGSAEVILGTNIQDVPTRGYYGEIPVVSIGGYDLKNVKAGFVTEDQSDQTVCEVMLGLGLLSRFNLVYDYTRQRMFVEPNESFGDPFN